MLLEEHVLLVLGSRSRTRVRVLELEISRLGISVLDILLDIGGGGV